MGIFKKKQRIMGFNYFENLQKLVFCSKTNKFYV
jgi:hypothetical protein